MDIPFKEWLKQREQKTGDDDDTKKEKKKSSEVTNGEEEQDEQEEENEENGEAEEKEELQEVDAGNSSVLSRLCSGSFTQLNAQTRRLHRHLYNLKNGLGRREDFVDLFSRKPADGTIKNEFFLDKAIVCEIMRLNVRFIPPSHPPFHVKFFLPTAPKEQAWITIPFGGANFPDLPDDFAIGQHYSMTLQQELLPSDRENLLRAKNHLKPYKFEDLYQRIEPTDIRPNDISTFTSETEDRDYVETIQFMDRGCRRILSRTEVNLDGRLFDIINSSNGNILAMRDDLLFNNFPMIERFQEQRMEGIIEPLPNGRITIEMAYGQKVHVDWRMTNLRVDHKGRFVKGGPLYKETIFLPDPAPRTECLISVKRDYSWKFALCRTVEKDHLQLKKDPQHSEELVEFCDRIKGALLYMRRLEEKIDKIKGFNPEEAVEIWAEIEEGFYTEDLKSKCLLFILGMVSNKENFDRIKQLGKKGRQLAFFFAEMLQSNIVSLKQLLQPESREIVEKHVLMLYLIALRKKSRVPRIHEYDHSLLKFPDQISFKFNYLDKFVEKKRYRLQ